MTYIVPTAWALGGVMTADQVVARPGGKGNNVARVAHRLGQAVTAVGLYGGSTGAMVCDALEALGIGVVAEESAGETRTCLTLLSAGTEITELRDPGPRVDAAVADRLLVTLKARVHSADWVTLSGSLPAGLDPSLWVRWINQLSPRCRGVLVDTSGMNLRAAATAHPLVLVPNRAEWDAVGLGEMRPLIVTEGSQGIVWYPAMSTEIYRIYPPTIPVRNSVGAGDALLGGLVTALASNEPWEAALKFAVAVATASVMTDAVADVDPKDVPRILEGVVVEPA